MPAWEVSEPKRPSFSNPDVSSPVSAGWKQGETMLEGTGAITARIQLQTLARKAYAVAFAGASSFDGRRNPGRWISACGAGQGCSARALILAWCLGSSVCGLSQNAPQAPGGTGEASGAAKPATPSQQIQPVTTTVVVHDEAKDDYLPDAVTVGTLDGATLKETPLSATVVTRDLLTDQVSRLLSDVVKNDASIGEDYAPVGYYGDYEIRGFTIDLATGLQINGMTIAGEQDVPLENKERVELLKGIAGVESGVASAGGLINYVTKRPAAVEAADLATDHRGSSYGAVDLGHLFGGQKQVGARLSLAGEKIESYVDDANGWRAMGAGAADWKMSPTAILKGDFEYQHKLERSVCGYQLLGGTTAPDLDKVYPSTMLGEQSWAKPNTFDTFNTGARLDYDLPAGWHAFAAGSFSHSLIDDNVVYAYGCYYEAECVPNSATPPWFFAPDGTYDIYDYRDPGELRIDEQAETLITGHIKTGAIGQDVAGGGELFLRSVQQPGYFTVANPLSPNGVVQDGSVYTYVGSENIYQPITPVPLEAPYQYAGPRRLWEDNHQAAAVLQDRIHLPGHIQLLAGGRVDSLRDHNYSLAATSPCTVTDAPGPASDPCPTTYDASNQPIYSVPTLPILTNKLIWLPQYAVTFNPVSTLTLYGNYGVLLSLGPQGPFWTDNASQFLAAFLTRQAEVGAKYAPGQRILLTTALFHMKAPFFYPKVIQAPDSFCPASEFYGPGDLCFESEGHETNDGVEVNAEGKAASWLRLTASAAAMRAFSDDTGTPAFDNKQVLNVPHLRTAVFADIALPHARGLHLMPGWSYTGRKVATRDDLVSVASYNLFNMGARYAPGGESGRVTLRLYADNITDKRYWKDTGASYGDTFIHLGAPTTVRLSAHYTF
jgi:iron complex outermembrane recepter protein